MLLKIQKTGKHRLNNEAIFRPTIYRFINQVECVFSILKRKFSGTNTSRSTKLGKKETILKNLCYNTIQINPIDTKTRKTPRNTNLKNTQKKHKNTYNTVLLL